MDDFPGYHDPAGGNGGEDDAAADGDVFGEEVDLDFVLKEMKSQSNVFLLEMLSSLSPSLSVSIVCVKVRQY